VRRQPQRRQVPGQVLDGVPGDWPPLLGYNQVTPKPAAQVLAYCGTDPRLE